MKENVEVLSNRLTNQDNQDQDLKVRLSSVSSSTTASERIVRSRDVRDL